MTTEVELHEGIWVMGSMLALEWPGAQVARARDSEQGGILKLGQGVRGGRISLDALSDEAKAALTALIDQMSLGAILRLPIPQIDPPRDNRSKILRPAVNLPAVSQSVAEGGTARWTLAAEPDGAWLNRLGSINGRTFRIIALAGLQIIVSPEVIVNAGDQPDAIADAVIRLQQRQASRMPVLRRAMSVAPALPIDMDVVEVID